MIRKLLFILAFTASLAQAQVSYTGGVYSQDFNTLQGTTNNTTGVAWADNSTLAGWYSSHTSYGVTNGTMGGTAATFDGTSVAANVGLFSFGTAASTDRALGSRATSGVAGNTNIYYGVRLVNNTAQTITSFSVMLTGEQWHKNGATTAHTLPVQYQLGATSISTGTWTSVATFTSLVNTATIASLDGNAVANRRGMAGRITGISWAPGTELWVRVADGNESGNEQAMAIDDFAFIADDESSLFFNGNSSYVSMGFGAATASLNTSSFTVECRFMRTGPGVTASTGTGGITTALPLVAKGVGEGDGSNLDANYFLGIDNVTGKLVADFEQLNATNNGTAYNAGQNFPVFGSTVLQNGVFYHVAATYDTATAVWKLYVNGIAETTTQTIPTFVGVAPRNDNIQGLGIGTTVNSTGARAGFFHGLIDEARIWNFARTGADIVANKDVEIVSAPGLLARYGFDEATGTTAAGTNAAGSAAPVGTLAGTVLPVWVNAKTLVANIAPTVSITAPTMGSSVMFPAPINLAADAADSDGSIARVEFFNGATKLGEDLTAPYTFAWTNAAVGGPYSITAVATDNGGTPTTSVAVTVTVDANSNQPPVVTIISPADNATGIGSSTSLNLTLADNEGDAQTVSYFGRRGTPATPGADFTVATLPDTQFYSENLANNGRAATYFAQTQWLFDNRNSVAMPNLAFISHMGDMVQNGDAVPAEWLVPDGAMKTIENPATTLCAYGIPYGVTLGNHDYGTGGGTGTTNGYNQYFGTSRFAGRNYYGGNFGSNNNNNYQIFSASGLDFIGISFEYLPGAQSTYQAIIDWADALLKAHPNRRAIITTHWMIDTGNPAAFSAQGQILYNELKDNPNLFLMLGGHVAGEGRRSDTFQGRTVYSVLQDYQGRVNGGDGWLRYFIFSPTNNTITAKTYRVSNPVNPTAGTFETDADSEFTLSYNMQTAVTDWIPLGTVNVAAAGTTASLNWTGLEAGKDYEWYASVNDGINTVATATRRFSTTANAAPTVAITVPANNASYTAPAAFTLAAEAADTDGSVARVEFYQGGTKLSEDTTAPYEHGISGLLVGSYIYTAVAVDTAGQATLSSGVNVTVNASLPPTVALTAPIAGATFDAPATINLVADAADSDGTVTLVEFFNGATKLSEDSTAPYTFAWTGVISGSYSLTAKATDNAATTTTSAAVALTVTNVDNVVPSVVLSAPANGASIVANAMTLTASASDTDGLVSKVEFYEGATKLGEDLTAPFTFVWSSIAPGSYSLTAVATDNDGGSATSSANSITVLAPGSFINSFTETFDTMGTGTAQPTRWSFYGVFGGGNTTFTDTIPITGTAVGGASTLNNTLTALTTFTTSSNTAGFNYALPASPTDRALGTSPTTGQFVALQLSLTNASGAAIHSLRIGYDIRRFTAPATANELPGYWLFYSLDNGTTWSNVASLNPTLSNVPNTIGVSTIAPATFALNAAWNNGANILFRWIDDNAVATSPDQVHGLDNVSITLPIGTPPTVALTTPSNGSIYVTPAIVELIATASDAEGPVSKVEFFQGATKLGESLTAPFAYTWNGATMGTYILTAVATDSDANATTSSPVSITVNANAGSGTLTRGPYLNQNNQNSIIIRWRTTQPVFGRVNFGTAVGSLNQMANESAARTDHVVQLTGLSPHTRYFYSIGSPTDTLVGDTVDYTFRTSPTPGTATDTRVWVVGDCGRATQFQRDVRDAYYAWTGSRAPDLCLMLGDNAYNSGTDAEYQAGFYDIYPTMFRKMPLWSCMGNHDANNGSTSTTANFPYFDMFTFPTAGECGGVASGTERYNSFDYGNIHFVNIDSQTSSLSATGPQAVWLANDLASTTKTWIIAFFHHPPYSKGSHDSDTETQMVQMRTNFGPILEAGGVDMVLVGHSHAYERSVLLDGHYGVSSTLTASMKKNTGRGLTSTAGGAYIKPLTGPRDHFGAVYTVTGSAGEISGGSLNHPVMYVSYNTGGTFNIDVNGTRLDATYVEKGATVGTFTTPDSFTMIKQGAADSDGDGVADEFEIANGMNRFSNADATADTDGDGLDAKAEYLFGLQPGASDRYQWTTSPPNASTGSIDVAFPTLPDRKYQVLWSTDLMTWNNASVEVLGDGTTRVWTDDGTTTGTAPGSTPGMTRFYRVKVSSAP